MIDKKPPFLSTSYDLSRTKPQPPVRNIPLTTEFFLISKQKIVHYELNLFVFKI